MATAPNSDNDSAAHAKPPAAAHTIVPAPIARNDQQVCFICLQNDTDEPNATWVNPCPCSLEAHEECMLQWVAEMETSPRRTKNGFKCPACKASITVEEPFDPLLALRDRLHYRYSRVSPYILLVLVSGGSIAGAAWYGWGAASIFAGSDAVMRWMRPYGRRQQIPALMMKLWTLSSIGPCLVLMRWFPSLMSRLFLPGAVWYSAVQLAHNRLPTWPLSPQWVAALMPVVQLSYNYLLYSLFGPLERRLNRALRGRPAAENEAAAGEEAAPAAARQEPLVGAVVLPDRERGHGIWGMVANLGRAVLGLLVDLPVGGPINVEVEIANDIEVRIGGPDDDDDVMPEIEGGRILDGEDEEGEFQILPGDAAAQPAGQEEQEQRQAAAEELEPQPAQPNPPVQNEENIQNDQRGNNNNDGAAPGDFSFFTLLINGVTTALLTPAICYSMGELIRVAAPKAWVVRSWRRPTTGLLQERWGRSLVGGCLYVVLRDMISLYTKYKRVQVKAKRRVKNVEKWPGRQVAGGRQ